jgi:hypothetical protein
MAVRKAITRSKKTFRPKVPSRKNSQMTHCESLLEGAGARFLEISPFVKSYMAQAAEEIYYDANGEPRSYFVDFRVVLTNEEVVDVEMKPHSKLLNPAIKGKYEQIAAHYAEKGRRFRMLTDLDVCVEPLFSNLKILSYHRVGKAPEKDLSKHQRMLSSSSFTTIKEAAEIVGGVGNVYRQIASGYLAIYFHNPLSPSSRVWIRQEGDGHDSLCV